MDYVQLLNDLIPSLPPDSLRDWAFIIILIPAITRLLLLSTLYKDFNQIFPKKRVKATKLLFKLRIKGMNSFLKHQLAIIFLPGLISLPILHYSGLGELYWSDLPPQTASIATIGLVIWVGFGIYTAFLLKGFMNDILDNLKKILQSFTIPIKETQIFNDLSSVSIVALEGLVKIRNKLDSTKNWATSKTPKTIEKNILPFFGSLGESITTLLDEQAKKAKVILQEIVSEQTDVVSEKFNQQLDTWFKSYFESTRKETIRLVLISAAPSIWLGFLVWHTGIAP